MKLEPTGAKEQVSEASDTQNSKVLGRVTLCTQSKVMGNQ